MLYYRLLRDKILFKCEVGKENRQARAQLAAP
jgi:hypothetical protein